MPNSFGELLFEKSQFLQRTYEFIYVFAIQQFCSFCLLLFSLLLIAKSCKNSSNLLALSIFEPNLHIRRRLLWVNSYANEQKCKQWLQDESTDKVYPRVRHCTFCFSFASSSYLNVMFTHEIQQGGHCVKWMRTRERLYNKMRNKQNNWF